MSSCAPMSARAAAWHRTHTHLHSAFPVEWIAAARDASVSLCLPTRNEAATIGAILEQLMPLCERGVVDQIVVVDHSSDDTAEIARRLGAEVHGQEELMPEAGAARGKGDAMWRALSVLRGDIVCFLDGDSGHFGPHYACGLLGPLLCDPAIAFVKGFYRRPFRVGDTVLPHEGGRVTELAARPLLNLFYPDLAAVEQPLAGEVAARRELLERLPFVTGYGVDIGLLLDAYGTVGLDALAQVNLDVRQNDHQPLRELGAMAYEVLRAVALRLEREGRLTGPLPEELLLLGEDGPEPRRTQPTERPPLRTLSAAA
jgi:glucosyl-3-phosphoglycerate synthase